MPPDGYDSLTVKEDVVEIIDTVIEQSDDFGSRHEFVRMAAESYCKTNGVDLDE